MEGILVCSGCGKRLKTTEDRIPHILPCGHTVCLGCLEDRCGALREYNREEVTSQLTGKAKTIEAMPVPVRSSTPTMDDDDDDMVRDMQDDVFFLAMNAMSGATIRGTSSLGVLCPKCNEFCPFKIVHDDNALHISPNVRDHFPENKAVLSMLEVFEQSSIGAKERIPKTCTEAQTLHTKKKPELAKVAKTVETMETEVDKNLTMLNEEVSKVAKTVKTMETEVDENLTMFDEEVAKVSAEAIAFLDALYDKVIDRRRSTEGLIFRLNQQYGKSMAVYVEKLDKAIEDCRSVLNAAQQLLQCDPSSPKYEELCAGITNRCEATQELVDTLAHREMVSYCDVIEWEDGSTQKEDPQKKESFLSRFRKLLDGLVKFVPVPSPIFRKLTPEDTKLKFECDNPFTDGDDLRQEGFAATARLTIHHRKAGSEGDGNATTKYAVKGYINNLISNTDYEVRGQFIYKFDDQEYFSPFSAWIPFHTTGTGRGTGGAASGLLDVFKKGKK